MSPPPNRASPITLPTRATRAAAANEKMTIAAYLTTSSRVRPAGTVSR